MKTEKILVRIAAILYAIYTLFMLLFAIDSYSIISFESVLFMIFGCTMTALFVIASKDIYMIKYKWLMLVIGIIFLIVNLVASVLLFVAFGLTRSHMNDPNIVALREKEKIKPVKEKLSPEMRKIDILTKFGVILIVLSGVIFATGYNDYSLAPIIKPIVMLFFSLLFYGLNYIFENKFVIKSSSKVYYVLSHAFLIISVITIGYYRTFEDLSFFGSYFNTMFAILFIVTSYSLGKIGNKYDFKTLEASFTSLLFAIIFILNELDFEYLHIIAVLLVISLFISMNENRLTSAFKHVNSILLPILIVCSLYRYIDNEIFVLLDFIIAIFVIAIIRYRSVVNESKVYRVILPIYLSILVISTMYNISNSYQYISDYSLLNYNFITIILLLILNHLFVLRGSTKQTIYSGFISTLGCALLVDAILSFNEEYAVIQIVASMIINIYSLYMFYLANKKDLVVISCIAQLVSSFFFMIAFTNLFDGYLTVGDALIFSIIYNMIISFIQKNKLNETGLDVIFRNSLFILFAFVSVLNVTHHDITYNSVLLVILITYRYLSNINIKRPYIYNLILVVTIYCHMYYLLLSYTTILVSSIILLLSLLIAAYYINRDRYTPYFVLLLAYIPYLSIISNFVDDEIISTMLTRLPLFFIICIVTRKLLTMKKVPRLVIEIILFTILFFSYIFKVDLNLGVYTFVVSLTMIFVGLKNDEYGSLFGVGIGAFILNIIVELSEYWSKIPLSAYLLISGLLIIGYVTYREIHKKDETSNEVKVVVEDDSYVNGKVNFINILLLLVVASSFFFSSQITKDYKEKEFMSNFYLELEEVGISESNINVDFSFNILYIVKGNHYDLEKFKEIYDRYKKEYKANKSLFNRMLYGNYGYYDIHVVYISQADMIKLKHGEYIDYDNGFYYRQPVDKSFEIGSIKATIMNDNINYFENDIYSSHYNNSVNGSLSFNKYDTPEVRICFSNVYGKKLRMSVDNTVYNIDSDGCIDFDLSNTDSYYTQIKIDSYYEKYPKKIDYPDNQVYDNYGTSSGNNYQMGY